MTGAAQANIGANREDGDEMAEIRLSAPEIRRAVVASIIGNGLEWFDFLIYGYFASVISEVFFPSDDKVLSLILTFATFAVGFFVRPFGGVLIGLYADRFGRQKALAMLILVMAAGTLILGLTPGYATIGIAAPLIIVAARVLQGLSVGGEFASATAMLVEYAPPEKKLFYGSFQMSAQALATALAAGFGFALSAAVPPTTLAAWAWRIPFLLGGLVGPVGFYIRRRVAESPEFEAFRRHAPADRRSPLGPLFSRHGAPLLCAIGTIVSGTAGTYLWNIYLPSWTVRTLHLPLYAPLFDAAICGAINIFTTALSGKLADHIGPYRIFFPLIALSGLLAYPLFAFVVAAPSWPHLFLVQLIATMLGSAAAGPIPGLIASLFPTAVRSTGMAISYNVSVTLFGGLAPFTVAWLTRLSGSPFIPAYYLSTAAVLSILLVATFRPVQQRLPSPAV